ncbi:hypothetical protein RRG08_018981 [Elysia crispata]|uniref:Uncharacterized protein n=1 Tax=Elysia crispata TaxID=231223 RepID=A0AAE1A544_9GAST|nr:hypothetical protein RRG08_018981 [Elysia crispata]
MKETSSASCQYTNRPKVAAVGRAGDWKNLQKSNSGMMLQYSTALIIGAPRLLSRSTTDLIRLVSDIYLPYLPLVALRTREVPPCVSQYRPRNANLDLSTFFSSEETKNHAID